MGKGNEKVDLTELFALGIDVEDIIKIKPRMLRSIVWCVSVLPKEHHVFMLGRLVECIVEIAGDEKLKSSCRPLLRKLSRFARNELARMYDTGMCDIRNQQRNLRKSMEDLKKTIDKNIPLGDYSEEEDKVEKILRIGSVFYVNPEVLPQC